MRKLIIIGAGGAAAEIESCIDAINLVAPDSFVIVGFLDSDPSNFAESALKYDFKAPLLGNPASYDFPREFSYVFGFASPLARGDIWSRIAPLNLDFPNIIHPSAQIARSVKIGFGNVISPCCVIGPGCVIGNFNLLTSYGFISHDCNVGSFNFFSTAGISGGVVVGNLNFFGIRSTILPKLVVGDRCVVQAGMIVDKNIESDSTIFFRYKEKMQIIR